MKLSVYTFTVGCLLLFGCSDNEDTICDNPKGSLSGTIAEGIEYKSTFTVFRKGSEENTIVITSDEFTDDCFWIGTMNIAFENKIGIQQLKKSNRDGVPENGESHFREVDTDVILGNFPLDESKPAWVEITSINEQSIKGVLQATYAFDSNSINRFIVLPDTLNFNRVSFEAVLP